MEKTKKRIYAMPLLRNIGPSGIGRDGWKLTECPVCKAKCYEMPQARALKAMGYIGMCTECMLKAHMGGRDDRE